MNAPYDGDRGHAAGNSGHPESDLPEGPPPGHGQVPQPPVDPYVQDAYDQDPYRAQDIAAQDPVAEALYDRAAHPPPPPGAYPPQQPLYGQPPQSPYAPDPRVWAQTPAPEPDGPTQYLPYGDDPRTTQFVGVDDLVGQAGGQHHEPDAFAHLFRDQQQSGAFPDQQGGGYPRQHSGGHPGHPPADGRETHGSASVPGPSAAPGHYAGATPPPAAEAPVPEPAPAPAPKKGGRAGSLLKSSAVMAAGTMVSRLTGFIRSAMIVSALGLALLGESFQIAYQLPTMIYILTVGGGLNSVFVPQLVRAMKDDEDGGEAYANRLLTLVMVALAALTALAWLAAPLLVRALSNPVANDPGGQRRRRHLHPLLPALDLLHGHPRGDGSDPQRARPVRRDDVDPGPEQHRHHRHPRHVHLGLRHRRRLRHDRREHPAGGPSGCSAWASSSAWWCRPWRWSPTSARPGSGFACASTGRATVSARPPCSPSGRSCSSSPTRRARWSSASWPPRRVVDTRIAGTGFSAYANAQLIWGLPQAIITVSLMAALLPRISRSAAEDDGGAVRDDISQGLRTTAVAIVPIAFGFVSLGVPMCTLIFGSSGTGAATNMGYMLMAFGLGLIPYSVQYVVLRAFYAYEDTRTPFYNTVIVAAGNAIASAVCFLVLPARWAVVGMAASYGVAYAIGVGVAWRRLRKRLGGDLDGSRVLRTYARLCIASVPAALLSGAACYGISQALGQGVAGSFAAILGGGVVLLGVFFVAARRMRIEELNSLVGMVRGRLGR
ncbi:hypothetical protein GCM10019016_074210 [Streptomyces prasinosporus]|uniref:Murein biosynthesis integral membrane protein MurJ n=1 Tax=Streptomyces prasinosporus TaxID=68256 RepID=A0ABP6TZY3_9ACTN